MSPIDVKPSGHKEIRSGTNFSWKAGEHHPVDSLCQSQRVIRFLEGGLVGFTGVRKLPGREGSCGMEQSAFAKNSSGQGGDHVGSALEL